MNDITRQINTDSKKAGAFYGPVMQKETTMGCFTSTDKQGEVWKIAVNDRYQKLVDLMVTLSVAAFVLPGLFLKDFLHVKPGTPLIKCLGEKIYVSWFFLALTIFSAGVFYYFSAKWIKNAAGQDTLLGEFVIRLFLNISYWVMIFAFIFALFHFGLFVWEFKGCA